MFVIILYIKLMLLLVKYTFKILAKTKLIYPFVIATLIELSIFNVQISETRLLYNSLLLISFIPLVKMIINSFIKIFNFIKLKVLKRAVIYG
ncbi:hypothetical protein NE686_17645 [Tissierella carlieri]|uniref:Uncharacterized protein n=1 Tax=Tissierella carlieri TaxID=689904 RepID=A0ABT1SF75_9FIRM|nr:hypothetical protein [Tissierella carlieri]MCQ4924930.1 hypothetical protein [Tissierella carlieri]